MPRVSPQFVIVEFKLNYDKMSNMVNSGVYIGLKIMLSIILCKKSYIIKWMSPIIEFTSRNIQTMK